MGQRSQIYVRYTKEGKSYLTARYYSWNYSERMISRCRYTLEWIKEYLQFDWYLTTDTEKLIRILDTNFDMKDVVISTDIIKEYFDLYDDDTFNEYVFVCQDNNDGKLLIDIKDNQIKYCFLDHKCSTNNIMSARRYMNWNYEGWNGNDGLSEEEKATCMENLVEIKNMATLMTKEEVKDFINCTYENASYGLHKCEENCRNQN